MSRTYATRMNHIKMLNGVLSARDDFDSLELKKHNATGEEILFLKDIIGNVYMFDVTGLSNAEITHTLSQVDCGIQPKNLIKDNGRKLELARIFR